MKTASQSFLDSLEVYDVVPAIRRLKQIWNRRDLTYGEYDYCLNACEKQYGVKAVDEALNEVNQMIERFFATII